MLNKRIFGLLLIIVALIVLIIYLYCYRVVEVSHNHFGVLEIPKLKLKNVIYKLNDDSNDVNKNVMLINDDMNFIVLAAHSGSSPISYFNKLDSLKIDDKVIFDIDDRKRVYKIFNKELVLKDGKINIKRYSYPTIVLITCSKTNKKYQELYYGRLNLSTKID